MGYWYCRAKLYDWIETETKTKNVLGIEKTKIERVLDIRVIEGKVLGMTVDGGEGSYNSLTVVTKEGPNPKLEKVSYELGVSREYDKWDGPRILDEILELRWVEGS